MTHEAVGCLIAGEFPLLDAGIEPAATVARARVYFKSNLGNSYYYVEMTQSEGKFFGKLPRPQVEASPITYYIQATSLEFGESQTPELSALVVKEAKDCPADKKVAAFGPPGPVQVFSAATGAAISPAGFALGGAAIAGGLLALIIGGALLGLVFDYLFFAAITFGVAILLVVVGLAWMAYGLLTATGEAL